MSAFVQWLRASGLGALLAPWLSPHHPAVVLGATALYFAEPVLGALARAWAEDFNDPQKLAQWAQLLDPSESSSESDLI